MKVKLELKSKGISTGGDHYGTILEKKEHQPWSMPWSVIVPQDVSRINGKPPEFIIIEIPQPSIT